MLKVSGMVARVDVNHMIGDHFWMVSPYDLHLPDAVSVIDRRPVNSPPALPSSARIVLGPQCTIFDLSAGASMLHSRAQH